MTPSRHSVQFCTSPSFQPLPKAIDAPWPSLSGKCQNWVANEVQEDPGEVGGDQFMQCLEDHGYDHTLEKVKARVF